MEMLQKAVQYTANKKIKYIVKSHPACQILAKDYPDLDLVVTNDPIPMLIDHCSLVYTSNSTSAAVDAYYAGKPVVTFLNPGSLNFSPLRGSKSVLFVSSPRELASVLNDIGQIKGVRGQGEGYFYLDSKLPRWKNLLVKHKK